MAVKALKYSDLVDYIYNLPIEEKQELQELLAHNITEIRRNEIAKNGMKAQANEKAGKLTFSSSVADLKKML